MIPFITSKTFQYTFAKFARSKRRSIFSAQQERSMNSVPIDSSETGPRKRYQKQKKIYSSPLKIIEGVSKSIQAITKEVGMKGGVIPLIIQLIKMGEEPLSVEDLLLSELQQFVCEEMRIPYVLYRKNAIQLPELRPITEEKIATLPRRPPIITLMGHVDHGKTTLLDTLRGSNRADQEHGKITQHISSFVVERENEPLLTFIDTPGHAAFSQMRKTGSKITDIVVLCVDGTDGVNTQTREAARTCLESDLPIIVAITKSDLPNYNSKKVISELKQLSRDLDAYQMVREEIWGDRVAERKNRLTAGIKAASLESPPPGEDWDSPLPPQNNQFLLESDGGNVQIVELSSKTGEGIDQLIASLHLQAELLDLWYQPNDMGKGVVLETYPKQGFGTVVQLLMQDGIIQPFDPFFSGTQYGRIRTIYGHPAANLPIRNSSQKVIPQDTLSGAFEFSKDPLTPTAQYDPDTKTLKEFDLSAEGGTDYNLGNLSSSSDDLSSSADENSINMADMTESAPRSTNAQNDQEYSDFGVKLDASGPGFPLNILLDSPTTPQVGSIIQLVPQLFGGYRRAQHISSFYRSIEQSQRQQDALEHQKEQFSAAINDQKSTIQAAVNLTDFENQVQPYMLDSDRLHEFLNKDPPGIHIRVIIKADVQGTADACSKYIEEFNEYYTKYLSDLVKRETKSSIGSIEPNFDDFAAQVDLLRLGVGPVTIGDVSLAQETDSLLVSFHTETPHFSVTQKLKSSKVKNHQFNLIFEMLDFLKDTIAEKLPSLNQPRIVGVAQVVKPFRISLTRKVQSLVAGSKVLSGTIEKQHSFACLRPPKSYHSTPTLETNFSEWELLSDGLSSGLRHFKDNVETVQAGTECGIGLEGFSAFEPNDIIVCYEKLEKRPEIPSMKFRDPLDLNHVQI